jgi:hypothetical protein
LGSPTFTDVSVAIPLTLGFPRASYTASWMSGFDISVG